MIRRSFLRRMAYAAMAGMLGAELTWRAPKIEPSWVEHQMFVNRQHSLILDHIRDHPMGVMKITGVNYDTNTITVESP